MRAQLRLLTIGLLLAALFATTSASAQWQHIGLPIKESRPRGSLMAIDPHGVPYVAYIVSKYEPVIIQRFDGSEWVRMPNTGLNPGIAVDFVIAQNGTPYIVTDTYSTPNGGHDLVVKKFDGTDWVFEGSAVIHLDRYNYDVRIAIDAAGRPFVAFSNGPGIVAVMRYDGTNWVHVGNPEVRGVIGGLAFDSTGALHLAYSSDNEKPGFIKFSGQEWEASNEAGLDSFRNQLAWFYLSPKGGHYAILKGFYPKTPLTVMKYEGSAWVPLQDTFPSNTSFSGLVFDAAGTPYIFISDFYARTSALMKHNGRAWVATDPTGHPVAPYYSPIVSDRAGNFYISATGATTDSVWMMKYTPIIPKDSNTAPLAKSGGISISPVPATHMVTIRDSAEGFNGAPAFVTDIQGREVYRFAFAPRVDIDLSAWPAGMYCLYLPDGCVRKLIKK